MSFRLRTASVRIGAMVLFTLVLTGCVPGRADDPVTAVVSGARLQHAGSPTVHDTFTVGTATMVIYSVTKPSECFVGAALAEPQGKNWEVTASSADRYDCSGSPAHGLTGSSSWFSGTHNWSITTGAVYHPSISHIEIEWDDGVMTTATPIDGVFYSFRNGAQAQLTQIRGFDGAGKLLGVTP